MDSYNLEEVVAEELDSLKAILLEGELLNETPLSYTLVLRPNTGCDTEKVTVIMKMDLTFPENVCSANLRLTPRSTPTLQQDWSSTVSADSTTASSRASSSRRERRTRSSRSSAARTANR